MSCCPPNADPYLENTYQNKGSLETLSSGLELYRVGSNESGKAIIIAPDIWGYNSGRTRAIADLFADQGYFVIVPKFLTPGLDGGTDGDGVPPDFNFSNTDHAAKFIPFMKQFDFELNTKDKIIECVSYLKDKHHVVKAALLGFCWGCWLIAWVLSETSGVAYFFNSAVIAHPSIGAEERFHGRNTLELVDKILKPLLILPCKGDSMEYRLGGAYYELLKSKYSTTETIAFEDENHGFWSRGDSSNTTTKAAIQLATEHTFHFFNSHF